MALPGGTGVPTTRTAAGSSLSSSSSYQTSTSTKTSSQTSAFSSTLSSTTTQSTLSTGGASTSAAAGSSTYTTTSSTSTTIVVTTTSTTRSTTTASTTPTTTTTTTSTAEVSWYFESATAVYNGSTGDTTITVKVVDNGSYTISPSRIHNVVPAGTKLVGGWTAAYYSSSGAYLCTAGTGSGCSPDIAGGGWVIVHMVVSGATEGETLSLTYSIGGGGGETVTHTVSFTVT